MRVQSLAILGGATAVAANTTVSLFLPGVDTQSIVGKVIGTSGSTTTYFLQCPPNVNSDDCGLPQPGLTIVEGPSTAQMTVSYDDTFISQGCKLYGTTSADCQISQSSSGVAYVMSTAFDVASIPYGGYMPVVITATGTAAGAANTAATATATTAAETGLTLSGTVKPATATTMSTATSSSSQTTASGAQKTASSSSSASGNVAAPMVTGVSWALGGAAMAAMAVAAAV